MKIIRISQFYYDLIKVSSIKDKISKSRFKIIVASRSDFLKGLGASVEIINYIESLDEYGAQFLTNEFRKNSSLSLSELQSIEVPENRLAISNNERAFVSRFPDGMQKWLIYELRKFIRTSFNIHPNSGEDYNTMFHQNAGMFLQDGLGDWFNNVNPNLDSLSLGDALDESLEWHAAMASGGAGKVYMTRDIVFGPKWVTKDGEHNSDYDGWTIQEVSTENDLLVEGNLMNHCVGSYWDEYDECILGSDSRRNRIFSLRDPNNKPHVTIETDQSRESALQIMGHSNSTPKKEYKDMIKFWVESGKSYLKSYLKSFSENDELYNIIEPSVYRSLDDYDYKISEFLNSDSEYGLGVGYKFSEVIDSILDKGLDQLLLHNRRYKNFNFCLSETLADYVVNEGDEAIFHYINKLSEYSDAAFDDFMDSYDLPPYPEYEDYETPSEYSLAIREYEELESSYQEDNLLTAWNDTLHKDLINKFREVRGEDLWKWHSEYEAEKERKRRYEEGSLRGYLDKQPPINESINLKNFIKK
jgi:hypothetical protein